MDRPRRRPRGAAIVAVAVALLSWAGVLAAPPSLAHSFTKTDGNDTPGKLDLASVSVGHRRGAIVYTFRTLSRWTNASLGRRSFFIVGIDKDGDRDYERCAFIFYNNRLRGSLTNCGANFIDPLTVSHPSPKVAKLVIGSGNVATFGGSYWWYGASRWFGRSPCENSCTDFVPNRFPDILHDLAPPVVTMDTDPLRIWETSTTSDFVFPFTANDAETGVSWTVQSRPIATTTWTTVSSGQGEGAQDPAISGVDPGQYEYRVVAIDDQGNRTNGDLRLVYVPDDVDAITGPGSSVGGVNAVDADAYGGSYVALDDVADSYAFTYDQIEGGPCRLFELIGPGSGTWEVAVTGDPSGPATITAVPFADAQRQTLYSVELCADATLTFTVTSGTGFGVDAVLS